jgi:hypothetical protein
VGCVISLISGRPGYVRQQIDLPATLGQHFPDAIRVACSRLFFFDRIIKENFPLVIRAAPYYNPPAGHFPQIRDGRGEHGRE